MNVRALSPSKVKSARLCEARLMARLDGTIDEEPMEAARTGTLAHTAAKLWYRPIRFVPDPVIPQKYRGQNDYATTDQAFEAAIAELANKINPKTKQPEPELPTTPSGLSDAKDMFLAITRKYNRDTCRVLFAERRYEGTIGMGIPVHLIVDIAVDRDNGILEVVDFKTGFIAMTTEEMWDEDQVLMNLLAVRRDPEFAHYPMIHFTYFWARTGAETGPITMQDDRLADYEQWLHWEYQRLLAIKEPEENINRFCGSCGRRFECKKYREWMYEAFGLTGGLPEEKIKALVESKIMTEPEARAIRIPVEREAFTAEMMSAISNDDIMAQFERLKGHEKKVEAARKFLGNDLNAKMTAAQAKELLGERFKARIQQNSSTDYNTDTVIRLAGEKSIALKAVVSPRDKEVKTLFAADPKAMDALNTTLKKGMNTPFVAVNAISTTKKRSSPKRKDTAAPQPTEAQGQAPAAPAAPPLPATGMPLLPVPPGAGV